MTLTYQDLLRHHSPDQSYSYDEAQVILYGLGIGLGLEPTNERQLQFVLEDNPILFLVRSTPWSRPRSCAPVKGRWWNSKRC